MTSSDRDDRPLREPALDADALSHAIAEVAAIGAVLAGTRYPVSAITEMLPRLAYATGAARAFLSRLGDGGDATLDARLAAGEVVALDAPERRLEPLHAGGTPWGALGIESPRAPHAALVLHAVASILNAALERFREASTRPVLADARLELLTEYAFDVVAEIDSEQRIVYLNPRLEEITGWRREDLVGTSFPRLIHPHDLPAVVRTFTHLVEFREPEPIRYRFLCRDGGWIWLESSGGVFTQPDGSVSTVVVSRDVTRRERSEAEIRQAQRLEAVGTLAGGVAHDFNNLLVGILGHASLLKHGEAGEAERREAVDVIEAGARRAAELTQQLLGFAGRGRRGLERVDVHAAIEDVTRLLARTISRNVDVSLVLAAPDPYVIGDAAQVQQVLLNLALNARDAMPDGGRLVFETRALPAEPRTGTPPRIEIAVRDTGTGIPDTLRERIFEPFFSTKPTGSGSGMGLAVVYGIVTAHHGTVRAEAAEPHGSVFRIALPSAGPAQPAPAPALRAEPLGDGFRHGRGRILVVDDEPAVRSLAERMLRRLGYEVASAADGVEALEVVDGTGAFDLVILDLDMPRMGGAECFRELRARQPEARVLVSTGFGHPHVIDTLLATGLRGIVPKPYSLEQLARAIGDALRDRDFGSAGPAGPSGPGPTGR